ncbi:hypothetical protein B0J12DRAFT_43604 [Macrophomina phaseolina]|uniref:Secreted protein n=1 Tax=Macrophomina phaseolina TaxID=35725 RepID=A0ABQ8GDK3_9PEZI|nr:hypothetical protein B0J12DRAFT_43604 [Macrophomina phaseolina]
MAVTRRHLLATCRLASWLACIYGEQQASMWHPLDGGERPLICSSRLLFARIPPSRTLDAGPCLAHGHVDGRSGRLSRAQGARTPVFPLRICVVLCSLLCAGGPSLPCISQLGLTLSGCDRPPRQLGAFLFCFCSRLSAARKSLPSAGPSFFTRMSQSRQRISRNRVGGGSRRTRSVWCGSASSCARASYVSDGPWWDMGWAVSE